MTRHPRFRTAIAAGAFAATACFAPATLAQGKDLKIGTVL